MTSRTPKTKKTVTGRSPAGPPPMKNITPKTAIGNAMRASLREVMKRDYAVIETDFTALEVRVAAQLKVMNTKEPKPSLGFSSDQLLALGLLHLKGLKDWRDVIEGLICSALESGSMATFGVDTAGYVKPPELEDKKEVFRHIEYGTHEGGAVSLFCRHAETQAEEDTRYTLDLNAIRLGVARMVLDYPKMWADAINDTGDFFTGDCFLQCATLGEMVYG